MNIQEMHGWFDVLQDKGDSPYFTTAEKTQFLNRAQLKYVNEIVQNEFNISGSAPEGNAIPYSSMSSLQRGEEAIQPLITELQSGNNHRVKWYPNGPDAGGNQDTPTLNRYGQFTLRQMEIYAQSILKSRNDNYRIASTWKKIGIIQLVSVEYSSFGVPFRYIRRTDVEKSKSNSFKRPTTQDPVYFIQRGGVYEIQPRSNPEGISLYNLYANPAGGYFSNSNSLGTGSTGWTGAIPAIPAGSTVGANGSSKNGFSPVRLSITVIRTPLEMHYDPTTFDPTHNSVGQYQTMPAGYTSVNCELPEWTHDDIMAIALEDAGVASRDDALMKMTAATRSNIGGPKFSTGRPR